MKLLERDEPLSPRERDELDAVDQALAGRTVDPEHAAWADLTSLIAEERPGVDEEWAAELDRRKACRFPRSEGSGFRDWVEGLRPMRIAAPAGALATLAIVAVVAVSTLNEGSSSDSSGVVAPDTAVSSSADSAVGSTTTSSASAGAGSANLSGKLNAATSAAAGDAAAAGEEVSPVPTQGNDGRIAPGTEDRKVDRSVQLTLTTNPEKVRDVSDQVIAITRSLHGIVASSQVSVAGKQSQANLQLTIPTRNLDTAIDQLTKLANVDSLNEATEDITRPFVSAKDNLDDLQAQRRKLLEALGNATTDTEAEALRLQIDDVRHQISRAEAAFENIARRANLSDLNVTVMGDPNVKEDRDLGDWFDDAVSVLRDVAGVLLISAAIVVPLGILVGVTWAAVSWSRRRRRERALDA
jgi:hypothetical protein